MWSIWKVAGSPRHTHCLSGIAAAILLAAIPAHAQSLICDDGLSCWPGACGVVSDGSCSLWCGACDSGQTCVDNTCQDPCSPTTSCAAQGANCGTIWDGCATVSCGACAPGYPCASNNVCAAPLPAETLCDGSRATTADSPELYNMFCGVGAQGNALALNWLGSWFTLQPSGEGWDLQNNATGVYWLGVAPLDERQDNDYQAQEDINTELETAVTRLPRQPTSMYVNERRRQYSVDVGGRHYDIDVEQQVYDKTLDVNDIRLRGDVTFLISSPDPVDGQPWRMTLTPRREQPGQVPETTEPGAAAADENGDGAIDSPQALFSARSVVFTPTMELVSAVKSSGYHATQMAAGVEPAVNGAVDNMLGAPQSLYGQYEPEAVNVAGSLLSNTGAGLVSFDQQRLAQFYMNTKKGTGFSNQGADRPLMETAARNWTFRQPIIHYTSYWPFLAGVCGLSAEVDSYIEGSFQASSQQCFDGIPMSGSVRGNVDFALSAAGGMGCNVVIASASAGLAGKVTAGFEFGSDVQVYPPAVNAFVNMYTSAQFNAYYKTRVLFWHHSWSKTLAATKIFQRQSNNQLLPKWPDVDLCALQGSFTGGPINFGAGLTDDFELYDDPASVSAACDTPTCPGAAQGEPPHVTCARFPTVPSCKESYGLVVSGAALAYPIRSQAQSGITIQNSFGACKGTYGGRTGGEHRALDLYAPLGSEVYPMRAGKVAYGNVDWTGREASEHTRWAGNWIGLHHLVRMYSGPVVLETRYLHFKTNGVTLKLQRAVRSGSSDKVDVGADELLGLSGNTGNACSGIHVSEHTHVYFFRNGALTDPSDWFALPLSSFGLAE